jgi:quinol monooxygenase YgiN
VTDQYVSGDWRVREGSQDEFVARWLEFTGWSLDHAPGAHSFVLIHDTEDPRHFVSFGTWADRGSVRAWRNTAEFGRLLGSCRELCDDFRGGDYTLAASRMREGSSQPSS